MNKENVIRVVIDDAQITSLAGNQFGRYIYKEQVEQYIMWDRVNVIVLPDKIDHVAIGFVQGFITEIVNRLGMNGAKELLRFKCSTRKLEQKILNDMY